MKNSPFRPMPMSATTWSRSAEKLFSGVGTTLKHSAAEVFRGPAAGRTARRRQRCLHRCTHRARACVDRRCRIRDGAAYRARRYRRRYPRGSCRIRRHFRLLVLRTLAERKRSHRPLDRGSEEIRTRVSQRRRALVQEHGLRRREGPRHRAREWLQDLFRLRHCLCAEQARTGLRAPHRMYGAPTITATSHGCARP